jgi:hypothetical protein
MTGVLFGVAGRSSPEVPPEYRPQRHSRRDCPAPRLTPLRGPAARSDRTPRESLDAPENLPKQATRQVALGQLPLLNRTVLPTCSIEVSPMETFSMSRKEVPRAGLLKAALAGRITNAQGARALGLSGRQFRRLKRRFREEGAGGLRHALRGRPGNRRLAPQARQQIGVLMTTTYAGFNDVHLTEKLREVHQLAVSRSAVRSIRLALGRPATRRRAAPQHRSRRPRKPALGQLAQLDASPFAWFEARGPLATLHGVIDDATSTPLALWFRPHEDLHGYVTVLERTCRTYGLPLELYGDRLNVFARNDAHWTLAEELQGHQDPTHFGRMLQALGIGFIRAHSPQAKGRIERLRARCKIASPANCGCVTSVRSRAATPSCPSSSPISRAALRGRPRTPRPPGGRCRAISPTA